MWRKIVVAELTHTVLNRRIVSHGQGWAVDPSSLLLQAECVPAAVSRPPQRTTMRRCSLLVTTLSHRHCTKRLTSLLVLRTGSVRLGNSWKGEKKKAYCNYPQKASGHHRCHWLEINSRLIDWMIDSSIKTKKQKINSVNKIGKRKKKEKKYKPSTTSSLIKWRWSRFWWIQ